MSEFAGNINGTQENLCVTATRGRLFVSVEENNRKSLQLTRTGRIVVGVTVAVLVAAILAAIVFLSIDWAQLPKYKELKGVLGCTKAEVEDQLPDQVKYAGAKFKVVPLYENDIFNGFQYTSTVRSNPTKAADVSLKTVEYLSRKFGDPTISAQEISERELKKAFKGEDAYYMAYSWDLWAAPKGASSGYLVKPESYADDVSYYLDLRISYHPSADDVHIEITFSLDEKRN